MRFRTAPVSRTIALVAATAAATSLGSAPSYAGEPPAPRAAQQVQVKDGLQALRTVASTATRPVGVLRVAGVRVTPHDHVRVIRDGRVVRGKARIPVRSGDVVRVIRVSREVDTRRVRIDKGRVVRTSSELKPGKRRVVSRGRDGIGKVRVVRWSRNGRPVDSDVVARRVLKAPSPRRVVVGARFGTVPGTGHLNWRALADCESSGNPRAVSPAGYAGLYQFDRGTWHSVGGSGSADQASSAEQTHRAQLLYRERGRSPWPSCGRLL